MTDERTWSLRSADPKKADRLDRELGCGPAVARILVCRGHDDPDAARRFLQPELGHMPHPYLMADLELAAGRLAEAILRNERIALFGDYDVDGVTSTALLKTFLHQHGQTARVYLPHRLREGYGLNAAAVEQLAGESTDLLVTLDCGITAADEIAHANALGMQTIVVDHHRCPPELPPALATLNPHQPHCTYPDKVLAAVGVCFNLVTGVRMKLRELGAYPDRFRQPNLRELLDLVALGTIADMVPLTGVNRMLAWFGLREMRMVRRPGLRTLMEVSGVQPSRVSGQDVAFRLGPRINAAGRLDDATVGVQLLCAPTSEAARPLAERLDVANHDRRRIEAEVFAAAEAQVAEQGVGPAVVVFDPDWHPGVVGIVASKLVEKFERPAIVIGEGGRGSARTSGGLHLYDALSRCDRHLLKFGGHRAAAGLRLLPDHLEAFRQDICGVIADLAAVEAETPDGTAYDLDLRIEDIRLGLARDLLRLEPFGVGNPEPTIRVMDLRVESSRIVGQDHLKLRLGPGPRTVDAIAFRQGEREDDFPVGSSLDVLGCVDVNAFAGLERVQLRAHQLRPARSAVERVA